MSDPQEVATPSDPHSAEAGFRFTDAQWREYQNMPEQGYSHRHWLEYTFDSWRDAEVAELKAKIAELHPVEVWSRSWIAPHRPVGCPTCRTDGPCPTRQAVRGSASSPVEGGN